MRSLLCIPLSHDLFHGNGNALTIYAWDSITQTLLAFSALSYCYCNTFYPSVCTFFAIIFSLNSFRSKKRTMCDQLLSMYAMRLIMWSDVWPMLAIETWPVISTRNLVNVSLHLQYIHAVIMFTMTCYPGIWCKTFWDQKGVLKFHIEPVWLWILDCEWTHQEEPEGNLDEVSGQ